MIRLKFHVHVVQKKPKLTSSFLHIQNQIHSLMLMILMWMQNLTFLLILLVITRQFLKEILLTLIMITMPMILDSIRTRIGQKILKMRVMKSQESQLVLEVQLMLFLLMKQLESSRFTTETHLSLMNTQLQLREVILNEYI